MSGNDLELETNFEEEDTSPLAPPPMVGVVEEDNLGRETKDMKYYGVVMLKKDITA